MERTDVKFCTLCGTLSFSHASPVCPICGKDFKKLHRVSQRHSKSNNKSNPLHYNNYNNNNNNNNNHSLKAHAILSQSNASVIFDVFAVHEKLLVPPKKPPQPESKRISLMQRQSDQVLGEILSDLITDNTNQQQQQEKLQQPELQQQELQQQQREQQQQQEEGSTSSSTSVKGEEKKLASSRSDTIEKKDWIQRKATNYKPRRSSKSAPLPMRLGGWSRCSPPTTPAKTSFECPSILSKHRSVQNNNNNSNSILWKSGMRVLGNNSEIVVGKCRDQSSLSTLSIGNLVPPVMPLSTAQLWEKVVYELLHTEYDYLRDLELILRIKAKVMTEPALQPVLAVNAKTMFANIDEIVRINLSLYGRMEVRRVPQGSKEEVITTICNAFIDSAEEMKTYVKYCVLHKAAVEIVYNLRKSHPKFSEVLNSISEDPAYRLTPLESFLVRPVQRICKYTLLLQEIEKALPREEGLHECLQKAVGHIENLLHYINTSHKFMENIQSLHEIAGLLKKMGIHDVEIIKPNRQFVSKGTIFVANLDGKGKAPNTFRNAKQGDFWLFSDMFLFVRKGKDGKVFKFTIPLDDSFLLDLGDNAFEVVHVGSKIWIFVAPSSLEKDLLLQKIEVEMDKLHALNNSDN